MVVILLLSSNKIDATDNKINYRGKKKKQNSTKNTIFCSPRQRFSVLSFAFIFMYLGLAAKEKKNGNDETEFRTEKKNNN